MVPPAVTTTTRLVPTIIAVAVALAGCAGPTEPNPARGDTGVPLEDTSIFEYPDSLAGRVATRLGGCAGATEPICHSNAAGGLTLGRGAQDDFAQIVDVPSTERTDLKRVSPGNPASSWLLLKLRNARDAGVETAMPLGSPGDPAFADLVEAWIDAGAPTDVRPVEGGS